MADIRLYDQPVTTQLSGFRKSLICSGLVPPVIQGNTPALFRQTKNDTPSDPPAPAGYQRSFFTHVHTPPGKLLPLVSDIRMHDLVLPNFPVESLAAAFE
jgi:hypothetical protein